MNWTSTASPQMPPDLCLSIWFARDVSVDIPWRTSDKRQRIVLAHEAADLSSMSMRVVPLFGCGMIPVGGGSDGSEIEASGGFGRPGLGATLETLTDMRAVSDWNVIVGDWGIAEACREIFGRAKRRRGIIGVDLAPPIGEKSRRRRAPLTSAPQLRPWLPWTVVRRNRGSIGPRFICSWRLGRWPRRNLERPLGS